MGEFDAPDIWGTNQSSFFMDKEPGSSYEEKLHSAASDKKVSSAYLTLSRIAQSHNVDVENLFDLLHRG